MTDEGDVDAVDVEMATAKIDAELPDGRRLALWRSCSSGGGRVAVLVPGFGRQMRRLGGVALYLVANGFVVYRLDPVNHVGLSEGDIDRFTISGVLDSITAAQKAIATREGTQRVSIVAMSLSAVPVLRFAASGPSTAQVALLAGVVNGWATLERALGHDYSAVPFDELPSTIRFERHKIDPRPMWLDNREHGWLSMERTIEDLREFKGPVANFTASEDDWVRRSVCWTPSNAAAAGPGACTSCPLANTNLVGIQWPFGLFWVDS